ncbi:MAG: alpha-1,2-fucosyltransferase [Roseburia sp.]|nr:alpha-1,2-fucosyltransferase [Roseburia sp.]
MRIVKFKGGLGNQLFQYAFGKYVSGLFGDDVAYDCQTETPPEILKLSVDCPVLDDKQVKSVVKLSGFRKGGAFKRKIFAAINNAFNKKYYFEKTRAERDIARLCDKFYFDGYWQCWKYVESQKDELRRQFFPKAGLSEAAQRDIEEVLKRETVCLGIRLGDYTAEQKHYMVCDANYYKKAIKYCLQHVENPLFYVFSNDVDGAKAIAAEFADEAEFKFREQDKTLVNYEELQVMAACRHAIIPNSTFHWWAAWLKEGENHVIVAPEPWFGDGKKINIVPDYWVKIQEDA